VGHITSSSQGYSVGKMLALGFVDVAYAWPGAKLVVNSGGRPVLATVTATPFFDPAGMRVRGRYSSKR
jgi:glycine cleavage system aminomethyltransferase T